MEMTFQVLTTACIKMTAFWGIAPCSLVKVTDVSEVHTAAIIFRPDDEGSKHLWNFGLLWRDYMTPCSRRLLS
jgi:hypothetical protein